jgi:ABC-2 type transport system permease protein
VSALGAAVAVESLKMRRSRLPWLTVLAFSVVALVGGLFMFILADQQRARAMGLLGAKASLVASEADWSAYFGFLAQANAVGGMVVFGLAVTWMFGREFSQDTAKDLLALPAARGVIVAAKFAVGAMWVLVLGVYTYLFGLAVGAALGLPGWSSALAVAGLAKLVATSVMTMLLVAPVALAASVGRGYLPGVGFMITAVFLAQIIAALGYGQVFPWSVPALFSGLAGPDREQPGVLGYALVAAVGIGGAWATAAWWTGADQDR